MSNPPALLQLSEIHLNQLVGQIKELHYFDGNPSEDNRRFRSSSHRGGEIQRMGNNKNGLNQSF